MEAEAGPQLIGSRCTNCSTIVFPPVEVCPVCTTGDSVPAPLSREGKLYSFSVVHVAPKGWQAPYIIGYVDLPEGVRIFSHVAVSNVSELYHDMKVQLEVGSIRVDEQGQEVSSFRFVPAPGTNS
jgi:uncharacterized OB-fold protein